MINTRLIPTKCMVYIFTEFKLKILPDSYKKGTGDEVGGTVSEVGGSETENMLVTIKPGNQYWKHCPLLEKSFTKHLILKFLLKVLSILKSRFFLRVLQMIVV